MGDGGSFNQSSSTEMEMESNKVHGFKEVVMIQFNKVVSLNNVEFRGGYYTTVPMKDDREKEIYVQDTREIFSNGCYILALLLEPKFDKIMNKCFDSFVERLDEIKKEFIESSSPEEEVILGESFYEETKDKVLLETYKEKKLYIHLELFGKLSNLLARKNYLQMGGSTY